MEYEVDVYVWKLGQEQKYYVFDSLSSQLEVTPLMRGNVLRWVASVNRRMGFSLETFSLSVSAFDRFLSRQPLSKDCLQLAALTSFFIAAKQEEMDPPDISELVSLCAKTYDAKHFRWMELIMLSQLQFEVLAPTASFFLNLTVEMEQATLTWPHAFTQAIIEHCLCDYELSQARPSAMAHAIYVVVSESFFDGRLRNDAHHQGDAGAELVREYAKKIMLTLHGGPQTMFIRACRRDY